MATKIRMHRAEIDCVYVCPACKAEKWLTLTEVREYKKLVCACGTITQIEVPVSIDIRYDDHIECRKTSDRNLDTFPYVDALVKLGVKVTDAKKIVDDAIADGLYSEDESEFVRLLISRIPQR